MTTVFLANVEAKWMLIERSPLKALWIAVCCYWGLLRHLDCRNLGLHEIVLWKQRLQAVCIRHRELASSGD